MPLTEIQEQIARLLAQNRSPDSYLAGGAAMHIEPQSKRYSNDLDYFHDSVARVATAFAADKASLEAAGFVVTITITQPGFVGATVRMGEAETKVEWAHDTAWRFMPPIKRDVSGYQLHPVDLAINKLLALVGRDEPRDFLDIMEAHQTTLTIGAMCWAAAGKDPGYTPHLLLSMLRRRGRYRSEDFAMLRLTVQPDLQKLKQEWLQALDDAESFVRSQRPEDMGCLFYSVSKAQFVSEFVPGDEDIKPHFGRPGGVLPSLR